MNIGDRIKMPCYVSPSGKHKPWRGPNPAPIGAPEEYGTVIGLNPCEVRLDNGQQGPALESSLTPLSANAAAMNPPPYVKVQFPPITGTSVAKGTPVYVPPTKPVQPIYDSKVQHPAGGGVCCKRCHDINPYAEPNQPDGSFLCRACRQDPYRFSL